MDRQVLDDDVQDRMRDATVAENSHLCLMVINFHIFCFLKLSIVYFHAQVHVNPISVFIIAGVVCGVMWGCFRPPEHLITPITTTN